MDSCRSGIYSAGSAVSGAGSDRKAVQGYIPFISGNLPAYSGFAGAGYHTVLQEIRSFFSIAFVCIGLETNFKQIFAKENNQSLKAFLSAQGFNILFTLLVAAVLFGVIKN